MAIFDSLGSHRRAGHRTPTAGYEGLLPVALGQITAFGAKAEGFIPEEGFRQETNVQDGGREALDCTGKQPPCRGPAPPPCPAAPPSPAPEQGGASRPQPSARACHLQGSGAQRPRGSAKDSTGALAQLVSVPVPQPWLVRERREPGPEQPRPGPLCAPEPHPHPTLRSPHSRPLRQRSG